MHENEEQQRAGNHEDVKREEARKRGAGDDGTAEKQMHQAAADEGHAAGDGCADAEAPVGVLIEAQNLAGEGHAERHQQQKNADDPGELAGKFVGAEEKHLRHVDEDDGDHEVRSPAVQRAQKPAERNLVIQNVEAVPRFARRRNVNQRQQNAGKDLQKEQREGGAAEDIPPACRVARHRVQSRFLHRPFKLQAQLEPVVDAACGLLQPLHEQSPWPVEIFTSFAVFESVGIWPASMSNSPDDNLPVVGEEAALRRPGGARAVGVVDAAVAGAHEELRLRKPAHGAAEVRAIDGEDAEFVGAITAHVAGDVVGLAVPGIRGGIFVEGEARFSGGKCSRGSERDPGVEARVFAPGREEVAQDGHGEHQADDSVESDAGFEQQPAAGDDARIVSPLHRRRARSRFATAARSMLLSSLLILFASRPMRAHGWRPTAAKQSAGSPDMRRCRRRLRRRAV